MTRSSLNTPSNTIACVACGRVVRVRKDGHPGRHKPKSVLRHRLGRTDSPHYCDGSNYKGDAV